MKKNLFVNLMVVCILLAAGIVSAAAAAGNGSLSREGYTLEQTVILSRHNIRSPLSGSGSALGTITPHEWFSWSSNPSELSLRGGILEAEMGEYFRKWLESEGLFPENYRPEGPEVRIYANSKQRTIATARYFTAGLLPSADTGVEYHMAFDEMDPVFTPQLIFTSDIYNEYAEAQIRALFAETIAGLADNYELIADVIDMEDSEARKNGSVAAFRTDDLELILKENAEPAMTGSLKTACSVSDALVLQYYEEPDEEKAAFGKNLTRQQWEDISEVKDVYVDVLYSAPLIAVNVAHPLLQEIRAEMTAEGRIFTFLCGHDSNLTGVLAALDVSEYELPGAIEKKTPIGSKLVFGKWRAADGTVYWSADLVCQTPEQLRGMPLLDLENPPAVFPVLLNGLERNPDGLYTEEALLDRFDRAIEAYDLLVENFSGDEVPETVFAEPVYAVAE